MYKKYPQNISENNEQKGKFKYNIYWVKGTSDHLGFSIEVKFRDYFKVNMKFLNKNLFDSRNENSGKFYVQTCYYVIGSN